MEFINLTPHAVTVDSDLDHGAPTITFPPSGGRATIVFEPVRDQVLWGFVIRPRSRVAEVTGLPEPRDGTFYIVSTMVRDALAGVRNDLVTQDSGPDATRANGQVISVRRFIR